MDAIIKWAPWAFSSGDGPIEFRVTGNADTRTSATFYWYAHDFDQPALVVNRRDDEPFLLDPAQVVASGVNSLGVFFVAVPKTPSIKHLVATISGRQLSGKQSRQDQMYAYDLAKDENRFEMSDGLKVVLS